MRTLVVVALAGVAVLLPSISLAQQAQLTPAAISAPNFDATLVEITAARLAEAEQWLSSTGEDPAYDAALRKHNADVKATRDWQACSKTIIDTLKPEFEQLQAQAVKAAPTAEEVKKMEAELKQKAAALAERMRQAKTPAEQQKIVQELAALGRPAATSGSSTQASAEELHAKADQQVAAKCGAEPAKPGPAPRPASGPESLPFFNTLERVAAYCHRGPAEIGSDGSEAMGSNLPAGAGMDMRIYSYSKSEAALVREACPRIGPLLVEKGFNWR